MMKVRIKCDARYALYGLPHGKVGAQDLATGDLVDFPDDYAEELIKSGLAEEYVESMPKPRRRAKPKPDTVRYVPSVSAEEAFGIAKKEQHG